MDFYLLFRCEITFFIEYVLFFEYASKNKNPVHLKWFGCELWTDYSRGISSSRAEESLWLSHFDIHILWFQSLTQFNLYLYSKGYQLLSFCSMEAFAKKNKTTWFISTILNQDTSCCTKLLKEIVQGWNIHRQWLTSSLTMFAIGRRSLQAAAAERRRRRWRRRTSSRTEASPAPAPDTCRRPSTARRRRPPAPRRRPPPRRRARPRPTATTSWCRTRSSARWAISTRCSSSSDAAPSDRSSSAGRRAPTRSWPSRSSRTTRLTRAKARLRYARSISPLCRVLSHLWHTSVFFYSSIELIALGGNGLCAAYCRLSGTIVVLIEFQSVVKVSLMEKMTMMTDCWLCWTHASGEHPVAALARERRRVQLHPRLRVFPAQEPHVPGLRAARAEPLRLSQAEQVQPASAQVHPTHHATGALSSNVPVWELNVLYLETVLLSIYYGIWFYRVVHFGEA